MASPEAGPVLFTTWTAADVKLADSAGHTVWACLAHADEILVTVPSAFLASQDDHGIAGFLRSRQAIPQRDLLNG